MPRAIHEMTRGQHWLTDFDSSGSPVRKEREREKERENREVGSPVLSVFFLLFSSLPSLKLHYFFLQIDSTNIRVIKQNQLCYQINPQSSSVRLIYIINRVGLRLYYIV